MGSAKIAIAYLIAEAERKSSLGIRADLTQRIMKNKSYFMLPLLNIAVRGHQAHNLAESLQNISFVIFNYGRCVERYLDSWAQFRFNMRAVNLIPAENFIHVYGSLGSYFEAEGQARFEYKGKFAFQNPHLELPPYGEKIKVFTEQEDSVVSAKIESVVEDARTIVFLGFGFEEQNMRFFKKRSSNKNVFSTLLGVSPQNRDFLEKELARRFSFDARSVFYVDGKSERLFIDCSHELNRAVGSL